MQICSSHHQNPAGSRSGGAGNHLGDQWLFCYGTLMVEAVFSCITSVAKPVALPATLTGFERRALSGKAYPGIRKSPAGAVQGVIYRTPKLVLPALDRYEGDMYFREAVTVQTEHGAEQAWCYILRPRYCHLMLKSDWSLQTFRSKHLQSYLEQIRQTSRAPK